MNARLRSDLLNLMIRSRGIIEIKVSGSSMSPALNEGDFIQVHDSDIYTPGDILLFDYKNEGLLVHRLLRIGHPSIAFSASNLFCKGDNSFRLEDFPQSQVIGKVVACNGCCLESWPNWKLQLSYAVHQEFVFYQYDVQKTKQTDIYRCYESLVLDQGHNSLLYQRKRDNIFTDSEEFIHSLYAYTEPCPQYCELCTELLDLLENPCTLETILHDLSRLHIIPCSEFYNAIESCLAFCISQKYVQIAEKPAHREDLHV